MKTNVIIISHLPKITFAKAKFPTRQGIETATVGCPKIWSIPQASIVFNSARGFHFSACNSISSQKRKEFIPLSRCWYMPTICCWTNSLHSGSSLIFHRLVPLVKPSINFTILRIIIITIFFNYIIIRLQISTNYHCSNIKVFLKPTLVTNLFCSICFAFIINSRHARARYISGSKNQLISICSSNSICGISPNIIGNIQLNPEMVQLKSLTTTINCMRIH